jgi:uncharacterized membrane protein YfcA
VSLRRTLTAADQPREVRFFLLLSAFGIVIGVIYWFVSYERAGTVLLLGFGVATGLIAIRLILDPASRLVRDRARIVAAEQVPGEGTGAGTGGVDRPFLDESGRLPDETIAPFAIGLGIAFAATGLIFGPAPVAVGALPFAWGAWAWLSGARAELDAQELHDAVTDDPTPIAALPPAATRRVRRVAPRR